MSRIDINIDRMVVEDSLLPSLRGQQIQNLIGIEVQKLLGRKYPLQTEGFNKIPSINVTVPNLHNMNDEQGIAGVIAQQIVGSLQQFR